MNKTNSPDAAPSTALSPQALAGRILMLRGQRVLLDSDLAELYGVQTRVFNQAVKRNVSRFPGDFMFQLSKDEFENLISQSMTSRVANFPRSALRISWFPFIFRIRDSRIWMLNATQTARLPGSPQARGSG